MFDDPRLKYFACRACSTGPWCDLTAISGGLPVTGGPVNRSLCLLAAIVLLAEPAEALSLGLNSVRSIAPEKQFTEVRWDQARRGARRSAMPVRAQHHFHKRMITNTVGT